MEPGKISGHTHIHGKPSNWDDSQGECLALHTRAVQHHDCNFHESAWYPSPAEQNLILAGYPVILSISCTKHPVVGMRVDIDEPPADDQPNTSPKAPSGDDSSGEKELAAMDLD